MPNASELDKYVTVNIDVKDGDTVKIMTAGEIVEFEQKDGTKRTRLKISIQCAEGQVKDVTLNETSRKALMVGYGKMTEDWVGCTAKVSVVKQNVGGQIKDIAYFAPIAGAVKEEVASKEDVTSGINIDVDTEEEVVGELPF